MTSSSRTGLQQSPYKMTPMSLVAVVGAGETGGAAARALGCARALTSYSHRRKRTGCDREGVDLMQSGRCADLTFAWKAWGISPPPRVATAIVLADSAASMEWSGEPGLGMLRRLLQSGCLEHAVVILRRSSAASADAAWI